MSDGWLVMGGQRHQVIPKLRGEVARQLRCCPVSEKGEATKLTRVVEVLGSRASRDDSTWSR